MNASLFQPKLFTNQTSILFVQLHFPSKVYSTYYFQKPNTGFWANIQDHGIIHPALEIDNTTIDTYFSYNGFGYTTILPNTYRNENTVPAKDLLKYSTDTLEEIAKYKPKLIVCVNVETYNVLLQYTKKPDTRQSLGLTPNAIKWHDEPGMSMVCVLPGNKQKYSHELIQKATWTFDTTDSDTSSDRSSPAQQTSVLTTSTTQLEQQINAMVLNRTSADTQNPLDDDTIQTIQETIKLQSPPAIDNPGPSKSQLITYSPGPSKSQLVTYSPGPSKIEPAISNPASSRAITTGHNNDYKTITNHNDVIPTDDDDYTTTTDNNDYYESMDEEEEDEESFENDEVLNDRGRGASNGRGSGRGRGRGMRRGRGRARGMGRQRNTISVEVIVDARGNGVSRELPLIVSDKKRKKWRLRKKSRPLWRTKFCAPSNGEAYYYQQIVLKHCCNNFGLLLVQYGTWKAAYFALVDRGDIIGDPYILDVYRNVDEEVVDMINVSQESVDMMSMRLNEDQYTVYSVLTEVLDVGGHAFVFGAAGTGKSFVLQLLYLHLRVKHYGVYKLAPTGIAARNIEGMTVHSFFGMNNSVGAVNLISLDGLIKKGRRTVLLIDECSMISKDMLENISTALMQVTNSNKPFGGVSVCFFGDFCQLLPVEKEYVPLFESDLYDLGMKLKLTQTMRQTDAIFIELLDMVRMNMFTVGVMNFIKARLVADYRLLGPEYTLLFPENEMAEKVNALRLQEFNSEIREYEADDYYSGENIDVALKCLSRVLLERRLSVVVGCRVMLLENLDVRRGFVNGMLGVVISMSDDAICIKKEATDDVIDVRRVERSDADEFFEDIQEELDDVVLFEKKNIGFVNAYPVATKSSKDIPVSLLREYPNGIVRFGCPSCLVHWDTISDLRQHVLDQHLYSPQSSVLQTDNCWMLNGIDLSAKFQRYREQVQHMPLTDYKLQDHLHEFLAMSGILLLKESEDYSGSLLGCFPIVELRVMYKKMMDKLGVMPVFNKRLLKKLKKILLRYAAGSLCVTKTRVKLLQLSLKGSREEGQILRAVEAIVNSANECEMMPFSEHGLSTSYLHPFLHGLLSDIMPSTIPHCLNLLLPNSVATATHRPDYVVDVYKQNKHAYTNGVGEMKLATSVWTSTIWRW
ncbi:hypothetical protein G6F37_008291 [Rhizopus arrhizus]|nr:hypothetical protein G6F38_008508 [Rhizopus arrhizus]KAG1155714.1 hypothetical protein G6F37_008291 [Rhizopus arrhizus]